MHFTLLHSILIYHGSTSLCLILHYSIMAALSHSTWVYIALPWLYFTPLDFTLCTMALLNSTWLYITLYYGSTSLYLILHHSSLHSTWVYIALPWLYLTLLDSTLLYYGSTWPYNTLPWLYTSFYLTLHCSTMALLHATLLYIALPWLYFTLLDSTLLNHGRVMKSEVEPWLSNVESSRVK